MNDKMLNQEIAKLEFSIDYHSKELEIAKMTLSALKSKYKVCIEDNNKNVELITLDNESND